MAFSGFATGQTVEQLRSQALTMFYGRRDGVDSQDYHVGAKDMRVAIDAVNTTAATTLAPYGMSALSATAASSANYTMGAPVPGVLKTISSLSTSTLGYRISLGASINLVCTLGSSFNALTLAGQGQSVELFAISSVAWISVNPFTTAGGAFASTI